MKLLGVGITALFRCNLHTAIGRAMTDHMPSTWAVPAWADATYDLGDSLHYERELGVITARGYKDHTHELTVALRQDDRLVIDDGNPRVQREPAQVVVGDESFAVTELPGLLKMLSEASGLLA